MRALHGLIPVPKMIACSTDSNVLGTEFYIMEFINGRIFKDTKLNQVKMDEKGAYWKELVTTLAKLHNTDFKNLDGINIWLHNRPIEKFNQFYPRQVKRLGAISRKQASISGTPELPDLEAMLSWFAQNFPEDETAITHGDYKMDNVIFHPTHPRIIGILDWELSTLGHPLSDLANALLPFHIRGKFGDLTGFKDLNIEESRLPSEQELIRLYCSETNRPYPIPNWDFCVAFSFFRMAVILQGVSARLNRGQNSSAEAKVYASLTLPSCRYIVDPHLGHLTSTVLADALKRWNVMKGIPSILSTGTDEHGIKIQKAAQDALVEPSKHCERISMQFKHTFDMGKVNYDKFIRTTDKDHVETVKNVWNTLMAGGYIYKGKHFGWYSVSDEAFYPEIQLDDDFDADGNKIKVSKETGKLVEWIEEENYMFKLSAFREPLIKWLSANEHVLYPESRVKQVFSWLNGEDFGDLSISRPVTRQNWGIQVPNDPNQTIYVWIDALANYLTVSGYPNCVCNKFTHVIGKDILKFHAIYWPSLLMALNLPLPEKIITHGHWTISHVKMSKSLGNVVDPQHLIREYGVDAVRYYILRDGGIRDDGAYSEDLLMMRYQAELVDKLGNLLSRCLGAKVNPKMVVPPFDEAMITGREVGLAAEINELGSYCDIYYTNGDFNKGLDRIVDALHSINKYLQVNEPWKAAKHGDEGRKRANLAIFYALESLKVIGILLQPIIPSACETMLNLLNVGDERRFEHALINPNRRGTTLKGPKITLFPKLKAKE